MPHHVEQQHAAAFKGLLETALQTPAPAIPYYDGELRNPDGTLPNPIPELYVLAYLVTSRPDGTSLRHISDRAMTRAILHCVGPSATACRAVAGRVAQAILDITPTIPGRVCWPIRDSGEMRPPDRDETTGVGVVMDQVVTYRLESVPA